MMHPSAKKLYLDELRDIDASLSNASEQVVEILGDNALTDAFAHIIADAQVILRLAIKLSKRENPIKYGVHIQPSNR